MRILAATSEEATASLIRGTLSVMGHDVAVVGDGVLAWDVLQAEPFRLVICDRALRRLDGLSLCRRIRALDDRPYTFVMLASDRDRLGDRIEGLKAGADIQLATPIDPEELTLQVDIARRIVSVHLRLERNHRRLSELATIDELTGLVNRREFLRAFEANLSLALRRERPMSLVMLDVDHFKRFNDAFGHPAGDAALQEFARTVRASCRRHEVVGRLGGEEFGVVLSQAAADAARTVAERIRAGLAGRPWLHRPLTASFGLATTGPGVQNGADLLKRADIALYASKHRGRDCITHYDDLADFPVPDRDPPRNHRAAPR